MIMVRNVRLILVSSVVLAACSGEQQEPDAAVSAETGAESAAGMGGMEGMRDGMMTQMMAHMQMMAGLDSDSLQAIMPMHRQMAANMVAQMNREMRDMNMTADAGWNATVDSLRQDLMRMPEMSASELQALMPGHHARMMRLMEAHRSMMSEMQM